MYPVEIRHENHRVFRENYHSGVIYPEVYDWLKENCNGFRGWMTQEIKEEYKGGMVTCGTRFIFFKSEYALLFKLTWGGL